MIKLNTKCKISQASVTQSYLQNHGTHILHNESSSNHNDTERERWKQSKRNVYKLHWIMPGDVVFPGVTSMMYCLIARDVMAAMLVVKNNSLSLRWELNFIFMQILRKKIVLFWPPTWPPCHVSEIREYVWTSINQGLSRDQETWTLHSISITLTVVLAVVYCWNIHLVWTHWKT